MSTWRLGPYRIEGPIAAGGMGEVHRAYDERLERQVAIKLIRSEARDEAVAHRRFLREARAAAGLTHPAIVQIHDILDWEAGTAIVMELVEGQTLSKFLEAGSLPVAKALQFGIEIAEGLSEAHARGIVHRDLKTDNIMVTPAQRLKILDFGLAKRMAPDQLVSTLTVEGQLLGTCHAMSPEQAQGFDVDHRSDLFSLGSLLYELTTGKCPFRGASAAETLSRILTWRQPPAAEINPEIPTALSQLIDRLLEKDPALRIEDSRAVVSWLSQLRDSTGSAPEVAVSAKVVSAQDQEPTWAIPGESPPPTPTTPEPRRRGVRRKFFWISTVLAALGLVGLLLAFSRFHAPQPIYVAVPQPKVATQASALVAAGVRVALMRGLLSYEKVFPLSFEQVDAVSGTPIEIARAMAADEVLTARLDCVDMTCQLTLSRVQGSDGRVTWIRELGVPTDDLKLLVDSVAQSLRAGYAEYPVRDGASDLMVRSDDYREYLELRQAFQQRRGNVSFDEILKRLDSVKDSSPRFLDAHLLEARIHQHRFSLSHDDADRERAAMAIEKARALAPQNPQPLVHLFFLYLAADLHEEATAVIDELAELQPGDATVQAHEALLENEKGNPEKALALMRTAVARHPSWANLFNLATLAYKQGDLVSARTRLQESLQRSPDNYRTLSFLAELETLAGNPEAVALYENLVDRSPGVREVWNLGTAYLLMGRYEEAATCFRRALELEPRSWRITFSLAEVEWLLGRRGEAEALYREALERSLEEETLTGATLLIRAQALVALGRSREAAVAVQEALEKVSDRPHFAFQAALVYSMLGEQSSALASMGKALKQGMGPRWFTLPWFDKLRAHPDFQALLDDPRQ